MAVENKPPKLSWASEVATTIEADRALQERFMLLRRTVILDLSLPSRRDWDSKPRCVSGKRTDLWSPKY